MATLLKKSASVLARILLLTLVLLVVSGLGAQLLPATGGEGAPPPGLGLIFAILFLQTAALAYPILRSRWSGWRLAATVAVLFFGTVTFLSQIESLVYLGGKMPEGMLRGLFAMGLINAVVLAPIAVWLLGRWPRGVEPQAAPTAGAGPAVPWARVAVAGLVILALYYLFGYYVAWQNPEVRQYYGGTDPGSFIAQMASVAQSTPWMLPFQYLRGLIWAGLALLVVRAMRGRWWEAGLATAALFTVPSLYLLMPNPLMPESVRMVHLVETVPYQFLFGWFAAWWLRRRPDDTVATDTGQGRPSRPRAGGGAEAGRVAAH